MKLNKALTDFGYPVPSTTRAGPTRTLTLTATLTVTVTVTLTLTRTRTLTLTRWARSPWLTR